MKMMKWQEGLAKAVVVSAGTVVALCSAGCGGVTQSATAVAANGPALHGTAFGGRQPISGATVHLYLAGNQGYGATNADLLTSTVLTDPTGTFNITAKYSCTPGQQMYLVAVGGDPGAGTNANVAIMGALGDCANLSSSTFININEVTTVGSVFALAPFMKSYSGIGSSSANNAGLVRAFASVKKLTNVATGQVGSVNGATVPVAEIYTLANILATCVNSAGGVSGDGSSCGILFGYVTPSGGTAPTDTVGAALLIAQNPANNVTSIYNRLAPQSPYSPSLITAPADWTMSVNYSLGGMNAPKSATVDANGNIWVANAGNNTLSELAQTGVPVSGSPYSGNGLSTPSAVALDASGNVWVANAGAASLSAFTSAGGVYGTSPFAPGGLNAPDSLAFDSTGNIWVANSIGNSITELAGNGVFLQQITTGVTAPGAIVINPK